MALSPYGAPNFRRRLMVVADDKLSRDGELEMFSALSYHKLGGLDVEPEQIITLANWKNTKGYRAPVVARTNDNYRIAGPALIAMGDSDDCDTNHGCWDCTGNEWLGLVSYEDKLEMSRMINFRNREMISNASVFS